MVNDHGTGFKSVEYTVRSHDDLFDVLIIADAGEHEVATMSGRCWTVMGCSVMFVSPLFGFRVGSVEDMYVVSGVNEVSCHRVSHVA